MPLGMSHTGACLISESRFLVLHRKTSLLRQQLHIAIRETRGDGPPICFFQLPDIKGECRISSVKLLCQAISSSASDTLHETPEPFRQPLALHIVVVHLTLVTASNVEEKVIFVVPQASFFPTRAQLEHLSSKDQNGVLWDAWGPDNARIFLNTLPPNWNGVVHGYKLVVPSAVLDFNQLSIARDLARGEAEGIITEATMIPKVRGIFDCDVMSRLPYRLSAHMQNPPPLPRQPLACMITDGAVIFVEVR